MLVHERQKFVVVNHGDSRKIVKKRQYFLPIFEVAAGQLADDEGVTSHFTLG